MSPPPLRRLLQLALAFACAGLSPLLADTPPAGASPITAAWQDASVGLFNDSRLAFEKLEGADARYGQALTLLMRQPKTAGNVDRAAAMLSELIVAHPDSETAISARYHLGRIEQTHRITPNPVAARQIFKTLIAAHPAHPYAEQAVVKLAIIDLYENIPDHTRRERLDAYVTQAATLIDPVARRDLHLLLADTAQRFDYPPSLALALLIRADQDGIASRTEQASLWVRIGFIASETERPDTARQYFEQFLANYPRDNRRLTVEERLASLPAPTAKTTSTEPTQ